MSLLLTMAGASSPPVTAIAFTSASYQVDENAGTAAITLRRVGPTTGEVSVEFSTSDGTATAPDDYTAVTAQLVTWEDADGDDKTVSVTIEDDTDPEAAQTINLALANPSGGAVLGAPSTAVLTIPANDPPTLLSSSPADDATGVAVDSAISMTFSANVAAGSGSITLKRYADDTTLETFDVTTDVSFDGADVTLQPTSDLEYETEVYLLVESTAIVPAAGGPGFAGIASKETLNFTSAAEVTLELSSSTPSDGATGVRIASSISLTFSENIQAGSGNITLLKYSDDSTIETFDVESEVSLVDDTVTISPASDLDNNTRYYLLVDNTAIEPAGGGAPWAGIASKETLDFTTFAQPSLETYDTPGEHESTVPAGASWADIDAKGAGGGAGGARFATIGGAGGAGGRIALADIDVTGMTTLVAEVGAGGSGGIVGGGSSSGGAGGGGGATGVHDGAVAGVANLLLEAGSGGGGVGGGATGVGSAGGAGGGTTGAAGSGTDGGGGGTPSAGGAAGTSAVAGSPRAGGRGGQSGSNFAAGGTGGSVGGGDGGYSAPSPTGGGGGGSGWYGGGGGGADGSSPYLGTGGGGGSGRDNLGGATLTQGAGSAGGTGVASSNGNPGTAGVITIQYR